MNCPNCAEKDKQILNLKRRLAMEMAAHAWMDMKDFPEIDRRIRPLGFRLVKGCDGHDPKIVPITTVEPPQEEKIAGPTLELQQTWSGA